MNTTQQQNELTNANAGFIQREHADLITDTVAADLLKNGDDQQTALNAIFWRFAVKD